MADAKVSKTFGGNLVRVRLPPSAPTDPPSLPRNIRQPRPQRVLAAAGMTPRSGAASFEAGLPWRIPTAFCPAIRTGFARDTLRT